MGMNTPNLDAQDSLYADQWLVESEAFAQAYVYHAARDLVPCRDGDTHLDIGSGSSVFLALLSRKNARMALLGVERNNQIVKKSMPVLRAVGVPVQCYDQQKTLSDVEEFLRPDGTIRILMDDIRTTILTRILGDRHIQSGSFLFPGVSVRVAHEAPYPPEAVEDEEERQRFIEVQRQTGEATMRFLARYLAPGGPLVMAERFFTPKDQQEIAVNDTDIRDQLGTCAPYFDPDPEILLFRNIPTRNPQSFQPIHYINPHTRRETDTSRVQKNAFVHRAVRNAVPWSG